MRTTAFLPQARSGLRSSRSRVLTAGLLGGLVSATLVAAPPGQAATADRGDRGGAQSGIALTPDGNGPVSAATVPLDGAAGGSAHTFGARRAAGTLTTDRLDTSTFRMVAVTWDGAEPDLSVRTRSDGSWTGWQPLERLTDGAGSAAPEASQLLWVGESDGVQVRSVGAGTRNLDLVLIDPGKTAADRQVGRTQATSLGGGGRTPGTAAVTLRAGRTVAKTAATSADRRRAKRAPAPKLFRRRDWGANNSWRNGSPRYNKSLRNVHIHHTATGNSYSRSDVPGIIRGMYRYHTKTLGWFDLGYNFVVDRFGRSWVGRSGGPARLVRGAHTLGFNHNSVGIAVIGNFQNHRPNWRTVTKVVRLAAWKLDKAGRRRADGKIRSRSEGSDRFRAGRIVRLWTIDGHRDTNYTACPGDYLYRKLPRIRTRTQGRMERW